MRIRVVVKGAFCKNTRSWKNSLPENFWNHLNINTISLNDVKCRNFSTLLRKSSNIQLSTTISLRNQTQWLPLQNCAYKIRTKGDPTLKSESPYKIMVLIHFLSINNNIKNPKNKASTKWIFITQGQKITNFRLLLETQVPDIVEQFRVADRWTRRLFLFFFLEKKVMQSIL